MSRRRRRATGPGHRRFRVVCSCESPPIVVWSGVAAAGPEQLPETFLGGVDDTPLVLHERQWLEDDSEGLLRVPRPGTPEPGQGLTRQKPLQWRCPSCGTNVSPTIEQRDELARGLLANGVSEVDIRALARTFGAQ